MDDRRIAQAIFWCAYPNERYRDSASDGRTENSV